MGMGQLWQKYRWAESLIAKLEDEVRDWERVHSYRVEVSTNDDCTEYVFTVHDLSEPPAHWSFMLGDILHNLRSCLDHLVYQLATSAHGEPLPHDVGKRTMFPIYRNMHSFRSNRSNRIGMLREADQERIEQLQPYNFGSENSTWEEYYRETALHLGNLEALEVINKHRRIHMTCLAVDPMMAASPRVGSGFNASFPMTPLEEGSVLCRWSFHEPLPPLPSDTNLSSLFPLELGVDEGDEAWATPVGGFLKDSTRAVAEVLRLFEPSVRHGARPLPLPTRARGEPTEGERVTHWPPPRWA